MDVWVVAAAVGAGYIAKHWKDLMTGGESISDLSSSDSSFADPELSSSMQQFQDKSFHIPRLHRMKHLASDISDRESASQNAVLAEASASSLNENEGEKVGIIENYEDCNVLSQTCLSPRFLSNDNLVDFSECSSELPITSSNRKMGPSYARRILRSNQTRALVIKPVNSLQSCLMAQLYKEYAELEDYMLRSVYSQSTASVRPLLVTDGSRIISSASSLSKKLRIRLGEDKLDNEIDKQKKRVVFGVPPLLIPGKNKEIKTRDWGRKLSNPSKVNSGKYSNSKGSYHGAFLFSVGISVGILSFLLTNKREVDKLNNLLKQTEDLVQDLQEELELKDSLTVKELAHDDFAAQGTHEDTYSKEELFLVSSEHNCDESTKKDEKEDHDQKTQEESMKKIEAELEAELAMLEINMNTSTLEQQFPDLLEGEEDQSTSTNGINASGHEEDSGDDEMERYLIKQILEKTRQGSPAVLRARKILFSMHESEYRLEKIFLAYRLNILLLFLVYS